MRENIHVTEEIQNKGLSRRTVVKGAAWSVPVIAAAVATPLAAASAPAFDVAVAASCDGNYDLTGLLGAINAIPLAGPTVGSTVQGLLGAIGLTPFVSRGFTISAAEGTIPAGTQFTLTTDPGLIDLSLLAGAIQAGVLQIVTVNGETSAIISTVSDIPQGGTATVTLGSDAVDVGLGGQGALALVGADNPTGAGQPNAAELDLISVDTTLGDLLDLGQFGLLAPVLGALSLTVQLCPGQTLPTP